VFTKKAKAALGKTGTPNKPETTNEKPETLYFAPMHYPLIIIGGGPIGIACALEAQKAGISYVILEKGTLVNSLYHYPVNMTFFSTSERLEIGGVPFVSNNPKPTRSEALEYYRRVAQDRKVNIRLFEEVLEISPKSQVISPKPEGISPKSEALSPKSEVISPKAVQDDSGLKTSDLELPASDSGLTTSDLELGTSGYEITTTRGRYTAGHVIIATGFYDIPYLLNVPGEELPKVKHYYGDPHFYAFQKVVVVGASNSAVDAALETWRKGAQVTMVVRGPEIGRRVKYWVRPDIGNRINEGSIKAYFNSAIQSISEKTVTVQTPEGIITLENDWVLAMTGYQPNLPFLRRTGIELASDDVRKPVYNEETHESNMKNIYLAGVICGGMNTHRLFIENSREHAVKIVRRIAAGI
jgi:thioredoxin reductase (NADPH)